MVKKPVLSAAVDHSRHLQGGIVEGSGVVVESVVYSGLPEVNDSDRLSAGDEAQHQQQQVAHHPAQSSQLECHEIS